MATNFIFWLSYKIQLILDMNTVIVWVWGRYTETCCIVLFSRNNPFIILITTTFYFLTKLTWYCNTFGWKQYKIGSKSNGNTTGTRADFQCVYFSFRLFVGFESHEQYFSYLATVTIAGDRAANLDLCLALTDFSSEGSFKCPPTATRDLRFF
jgi:hypothetical protein